MSDGQPSLIARFGAEVLGTFILVFFGLGAVHNAVTTGTYSGVLQVGLVWGFGVIFGAYAVGSVSGAHLNPAITLSLAAWGSFRRRDVLPYWIAQTLGATLAALALHVIFADTIAAFELKEGITRGIGKSVITASMYGEYFPNPTVAIHGATEDATSNLDVSAAFLAELIGTAILALMIFALTDRSNSGSPPSNLAPLFIGMTVAGIIAVIGPMTQACLNPARDFGPRIVAYFAGWSDVAFPGPRGATATLLVYLAAPLAGGLAGGWVYQKLLRPER
jgi:glycerol uptake facilitator protein